MKNNGFLTGVLVSLQVSEVDNGQHCTDTDIPKGGPGAWDERHKGRLDSFALLFAPLMFPFASDMMAGW